MNPIPKYCDTPEKVEAWKAEQRAADKARGQTPERKAYQKAYQKARHETPEYKAYKKAYRKTPEYKAYRKTPEYKAYYKARYQNLSKEQSTADAFRMMQAASELAKALTNLPNTKTQ